MGPTPAASEVARWCFARLVTGLPTLIANLQQHPRCRPGTPLDQISRCPTTLTLLDCTDRNLELRRQFDHGDLNGKRA
jgi:hypothetical protein